MIFQATDLKDDELDYEIIIRGRDTKTEVESSLEIIDSAYNSGQPETMVVDLESLYSNQFHLVLERAVLEAKVMDLLRAIGNGVEGVWSRLTHLIFRLRRLKAQLGRQVTWFEEMERKARGLAIMLGMDWYLEERVVEERVENEPTEDVLELEAVDEEEEYTEEDRRRDWMKEKRNRRDRETVRCLNCWGFGHMKRDCREEKVFRCYGCGKPGVRQDSCRGCQASKAQQETRRQRVDRRT